MGFIQLEKDAKPHFLSVQQEWLMKLRASEGWHMPLITMYATTQIMFMIA